MLSYISPPLLHYFFQTYVPNLNKKSIQQQQMISFSRGEEKYRICHHSNFSIQTIPLVCMCNKKHYELLVSNVLTRMSRIVSATIFMYTFPFHLHAAEKIYGPTECTHTHIHT